MNKINWIPGKDYLCRDGSKFRCYAYNPDWGTYCVHGRGGGDGVESRTLQGEFPSLLKNHPADVISEWIERPVIKWGMLGHAFDDYKWAAMDKDGTVCIYNKAPTCFTTSWTVDAVEHWHATRVLNPSFFTFSGDWKDSLVERK